MKGEPVGNTHEKLTLLDIADLRAYERQRDEFRARIIELKKRRRVQVGPLVTLVFESRDTVRFQVQEMARAERMLRDDQIQQELDVYNPLIPGPGRLTATLFIELTTEGELREWLPRLVGVEAAVALILGPAGTGRAPVIVPSVVDPLHQAQLTRPDVTAAVHYVSFALTEEQIERFRNGPVSVAIDLPGYSESTVLSDETRAVLMKDLKGPRKTTYAAERPSDQ
jgi:hypothetical protein